MPDRRGRMTSWLAERGEDPALFYCAGSISVTPLFSLLKHKLRDSAPDPSARSAVRSVLLLGWPVRASISIPDPAPHLLRDVNRAIRF
jgi:hypothetical protein